MIQRLVALVLVVGCGGTRQVQEDLVWEAHKLQQGLRWRQYEDVTPRLPPADREAFLDERDEVDEDLLIDDYEIMRVRLRGEDAAVIQVKFTWHLDSRGVVHDTTVEQLWERKGKHWYMTAQGRRRGEEMPGVSDDLPEGLGPSADEERTDG